jgi:pimeloyl-ACP methyl ester carboxylesterase
VKLQDSVTAIREEIARFAQPPVLVGHSWGGFPVTIAAAENPAAVAGMAYLAAYLPVDGESFREARSPEVSPEREGAVEIEGASLSLRRERAIPLLYHDVPEPWAKEATARLEPEWRGPQAEVVRLARTNWRELPKLYVRTEYDRMIPPGWQDRMAARAEPVSVESLRSGHSPFLSLPAELAAVLLRFFK